MGWIWRVQRQFSQIFQVPEASNPFQLSLNFRWARRNWLFPIPWKNLTESSAFQEGMNGRSKATFWRKAEFLWIYFIYFFFLFNSLKIDSIQPLSSNLIFIIGFSISLRQTRAAFKSCRKSSWLPIRSAIWYMESTNRAWLFKIACKCPRNHSCISTPVKFSLPDSPFELLSNAL